MVKQFNRAQVSGFFDVTSHSSHPTTIELNEWARRRDRTKAGGFYPDRGAKVIQSSGRPRYSLR